MENWLLNEVLVQQRVAALDRVHPRVEEARTDAPAHGLRHAIATTLVRAGACLDRDAVQAIAPLGADGRREVMG